MLPPTTNTEPVFLKPRIPFNVRTLIQIGHVGLVMSLESLNIDVCYLSEACIQDSSELQQIGSPSVASKSLFHVRLSGDPMAFSFSFAEVGVTLTTRAESTLIDWISINSGLCAVRLESYVKVRKNLWGKRYIFVRLQPECDQGCILPPVNSSTGSAFDRYWYGRGWAKLAFPVEMLSHGHCQRSPTDCLLAAVSEVGRTKSKCLAP
ncbi:unnamed protein product [Schistosoma curassoni]|nr:unnamed protein product [Schistosoma curassoni]